MAYFLQYNDIIVSEFAGYGTVSVDMPSLPEHELTTKTVNGRNGDLFFSSRDKSREITLSFNVRTKNIEEYEQTVKDLKDCFKTKDESELYIGTEDRYINAIVETYDFSDVFVVENSCYGEGQIKFLCVDPYFYNGDIKTYDEQSEDELDNEGDVATYPKISVEFQENSTFLQVDSDNGTILLGKYPKAEVEKQATSSERILYDQCNSLSNWTTVGNVVDEGSTGDTFVIGECDIENGLCFKPNITSSSSGWHGGAYRINLPKNVKDFEANGFFYFTPNSIPVTGSKDYKVTASVALNIREGRGTSYKKIGSIPRGTIVGVTDIQSGWGKVSYNGKTGYCSMKYLSDAINSNSTTDANYKTTANLNMRSGRGTKYKIKLTIPKNTLLKITNISGSWGKTTYKNTTGYVNMGYVSKIASSSAITIVGKDTDDNAKENTEASAKMGLLEMYGFDSNNNKLFKAQLLDNNYYYKHTIPSVYIGSTQVYTDTTACPSIKTKKDKDSGKRYKVDSGDSNNGWTDFWGRISVSRNENIWNISITKLDKSFNVLKRENKTNLVNEKYPTGDLAYIVIYMAAYGDYLVQEMATKAVNVFDFSPNTPEPYNEIIFEPGDIVDIDCYENTITKNGEDFRQYLDIGSVFFPLSPGINNISVATSCTTQVSAAISFVEKFN